MLEGLLRGRNINALCYGDCDEHKVSKYFSYSFTKHYSRPINYAISDNTYHISLRQVCKTTKSSFISFIKDITSSRDYYSQHNKRIIVLYNLEHLSLGVQTIIPTLIDNSFSACTFILFTNSYSKVSNSIKSRCVCIRVPYTKTALSKDKVMKYTGEVYRSPLEVTMHKIVTIYKSNDITCKDIELIKEIAYRYYMYYESSVPLQIELCKLLMKQSKIPHMVIYEVIQKITEINVLYQHSYKKSLFMEYLIIAVYHHIRDYVTYL